MIFKIKKKKKTFSAIYSSCFGINPNIWIPESEQQNLRRHMCNFMLANPLFFRIKRLGRCFPLISYTTEILRTVFQMYPEEKKSYYITQASIRTYAYITKKVFQKNTFPFYMQHTLIVSILFHSIPFPFVNTGFDSLPHMGLDL